MSSYLRLFLTAGVFVQTAHAHGYMLKPTYRQAEWIDGIVGTDSLNPTGFDYPQPHNFQQANYPYENFAPTSASSPGASGMEHSVTSFSCHDMKSGEPTDVVVAGGTLDVEWYLQANHPGDCALYISYDEAKDTPMTWIKLHNFVGCAGDAGMLEGNNFPPRGAHCSPCNPALLATCTHYCTQ